MFQITDRAAQQLSGALAQSDAPDSACFRILLDGERLQLGVDEHRDGDVSVDFEGSPLLVYESALTDRLSDCTLDFDEQAASLVLVVGGEAD